MDIYPTILDAAGIEPNAKLHGRSLRPVLGDTESNTWRKTLVAEFHYHGASPFFPRRAITDGRFKLIHNIRAGELSASPSVDGDRAPQLAQKWPPNHPARKAMERLNNPPEWEFFDLEQDSVEFINLSNNSTFSGEMNRLKQALKDWQKQTDDPFTDSEFREQVEAKFRR